LVSRPANNNTVEPLRLRRIVTPLPSTPESTLDAPEDRRLNMEHTGPEGEISPISRTSRGSVGSSFVKSSPRARSTYHRAVVAGSSRFSHPRPAPPPPAERSSPASPVIANSAFAHLDYFSAARPASSPLVKRSNTIATRTVATYPTMPLVDEIDLASPRVLDSPEMTSTKRRTVQFGERSNVNWARPLRSAMPMLEERPASPGESRVIP